MNNEGTIALIPHPSDDPRDPLNWPMRRKVPIVAALCLATFAGCAGGLAGQLIPAPQAKLYGVEITKMAYQTSCSNAGMIAGSLILFPLSHKFGRSSVIFWSTVGVFITQVWAACMTDSTQYAPFLASRVMAGFFGTIAGILGPRILFDLFFLHQRGRVFTYFYWAFDFGTVAGPTLSAFISTAGKGSWTYAFWWTAALAALAAIMVFLFVHETSWDRSEGADNSAIATPDGFIASKLATFLPGTKVTKQANLKQVLGAAANPFLIMANPSMILLAMFTLISFGFYVAMNAITPVWLQKGVKEGGYGFTSKENALFSLGHWAGIIIALIYGHFVSDRLPLWICSRNRGLWKPEYRLYALILPALIFNPIGLGLFGATLQNHWSWGVLIWAQIMVTFGSLSITPITANYACELFTKAPAETAIVMNNYRVAFGLSVSFYITPWVEELGFRWTYGMMAFLQVASFIFVVILMWKGHEIREWKVGGLSSDEEGQCVMDKGESISERSVGSEHQYVEGEKGSHHV
ncbi:putative polyamine transporter protein [Botrytis fragariae]|uniref:Putative polyamine transporter protein n=1 Tax=Botrytis fragariae TaxID=1964551 RepID=A0A8H6AZW1_9HELO|nr:putative polyamine transporter protein [Botrytis fragariae]KAF5876774.1 putative polyamine transporter protein [Botrytis fragariae]